MLKCSLPSAHSLCALEKTTPVNAAREILAPVHFPGKSPISLVGQDFWKELKCLCTSTVLCPSTGTCFQMSTICYWYTCSEEGDTVWIFFQVLWKSYSWKFDFLEWFQNPVWVAWTPSSMALEQESIAAVLNTVHSLQLETEKAYSWF